MRTVAVIQARLRSTRLPGKVLLDLAGMPVLGRIVERARAASKINDVIVATSDDPSDDPISKFCEEFGVPCFRGSERDVLDRFYQAALSRPAESVVRITGDCPLLDPQVVNHVIDGFLKQRVDYASNTILPTYPDGLDVEVMLLSALERAWKEAREPYEREHVTPYLRTAEQFTRLSIAHPSGKSFGNLRWTLDEPKDYRFIRSVYDHLSSTCGSSFSMNTILELIESEPSMQAELNGSIRNEGFYKSLADSKPIPTSKNPLQESQKWKKRAEALIPSCSQTFSKCPTQFVQGVAPHFVQRAKGAHVWDVDGNEYLDYAMALGAVILGHGYERVSEAAIRQLADGTLYSLPHTLEVSVAERLVDIIPCAEMVRFGKNGSDATSGAIRAARAYTGRERIACCGYHGWQDWFIGITTRNRGVPKSVRELTHSFEYNKLETLERIFLDHPGEIAAVILEPMGLVEPSPGFLEGVRKLASQHGAVLIFDEIVTGFRLSLGGAQEYFGVTPDLACFGKAMGNGFPISAVVGQRDIMKIFDEIFFSFTAGGEAVSLAATQAVIDEMREKPVIAELWEKGQRIKDGYHTLAKHYGVDRFTRCQGIGPRTVAQFMDEKGTESLVLKSFFQQECIDRGILFTAGHNLSFSHTEQDIQKTLQVYRTVMENLADTIRQGDVEKQLRGQPLEAVFRKP